MKYIYIYTSNKQQIISYIVKNIEKLYELDCNNIIKYFRKRKCNKVELSKFDCNKIEYFNIYC